MTNAQFLKTIQNMQNQNNSNAKAVAEDSFNKSMYAQKDSQAYNSREAQINRMFQLEMSNTAHQREKEDLQKAGLNPVLSANNGAPVTSGATASSGQAQAQKAELDMQAASLYSNWLMNKQNNAMQLKINKLNNANALKMSQLAASAQMYSANMGYQSALASASAQRYSAQKGLEASIYGSDQSYKSSVYKTKVDAYLQAKGIKGNRSNTMMSIGSGLAQYGLSGVTDILKFGVNKIF